MLYTYTRQVHPKAKGAISKETLFHMRAAAADENENPNTPRAVHKACLTPASEAERLRRRDDGNLNAAGHSIGQKKPLHASGHKQLHGAPCKVDAEDNMDARRVDVQSWIRRITQERIACEAEGLSKDQQQGRLGQLYRQATREVGTERGGARIWIDYALLQG